MREDEKPQRVVIPALVGQIPHEGLNLLLGGIGTGKSVLAYGIMEEHHRAEPGRHMFTYGFPEVKRDLLPGWMRTTDDFDFPEESEVVVDEAYLHFHSHDHQTERSKLMDQLAGLSRQKGILTHWITQSARKLNIAEVSGAQVVLIKRPDVMQVRLDRPELRPLLREALQAFRKAGQPYQAHTFVLSADHDGLMVRTNTPPTFWTEDLSKAWKGVPLVQPGAAGPMSAAGRYTCVDCLPAQVPSIGVCECHGNSVCAAHLEEHKTVGSKV